MIAGFYGDDFTGSTDSLGEFGRFGLTAILLLRPPAREELERYARSYDVVGVAGTARSLRSEAIDAEIAPVFARFASAGARLFQYKVCSTFDSSPAIGSFEPPIRLGREHFGNVPVPVAPAQPTFGRYTLFANHFANFGGTVYRLDRHPGMSKHPSTPMHEADLRLHLARQTTLPIGHLPITALRSKERRALYERVADAGPGAIVIDALENDDLLELARLLDEMRGGKTIFALGSGGISRGFGRLWSERGEEIVRPAREPVEKLLVVSGSCAPQTAAQIEWALANGWAGVRVDIAALMDETRRAHTLDDLITATSAAFKRSARGAVVYSALGAPDALSSSGGAASPQVLGEALGTIVRRLVHEYGLQRAIVAGGDTSSYAARALAARSLEILKLVVPVGPLCKIASDDRAVDGMEVMLKGGQVGGESLFEIVRNGG